MAKATKAVAALDKAEQQLAELERAMDLLLNQTVPDAIGAAATKVLSTNTAISTMVHGNEIKPTEQ